MSASAEMLAFSNLRISNPQSLSRMGLLERTVGHRVVIRFGVVVLKGQKLLLTYLG